MERPQICLLFGDAKKELNKIPDKSIDLVIIDPPYKIEAGGHGKGDLVERQTKRNELLKNKGLFEGFDFTVLNQIQKKMKKTNIFIFCSKKQIFDLMSFYKNKSDTFDLLTWHKTNPSPLANNTYLNDTEYILHFREKGIAIKGEIAQKKKYFITPVNQKDKKQYGHPTIKPLEIIKQLIINASNEGETVLDCFMGSGTTGVACKQLNRNFIGIEINTDYYKIAFDRINEKPDEQISFW